MDYGRVQVGTAGVNTVLATNTNNEYVNNQQVVSTLAWSAFSYEFTVSEGVTNIRVSLQNDAHPTPTGNNSAINFDNVDLELVPEPSSILLLNAGALAYLLRRRR